VGSKQEVISTNPFGEFPRRAADTTPTAKLVRQVCATADQLAELVRAGFAATTTERMLGEWRQPLELAAGMMGCFS
jgi:hypothetical protein